jgi:hypothetical protein
MISPYICIISANLDVDKKDDYELDLIVITHFMQKCTVEFWMNGISFTQLILHFKLSFCQIRSRDKHEDWCYIIK